MRYKIDNEGYILDVYFNCHTGTCNEYTGEIPSGYSSLEEWAENANIRAYKIVEGNLVFDASKDAELQALYEQEQYDNSYVTHKEIEGISSTPQTILELYENKKVIGEFITFDNGSDLPINKINIKPLEELTNEITLTVTGANILPNELTTLTQDGVKFTQNIDKSISINGTASSNVEVNLAGTSTNTDYILTFKKDVTYNLSGLVENIYLNFYCYDGTDREHILTTNNGEITFNEDKHVTQITISTLTGTYNNTTYPMLSIGEKEYEPYNGSHYKINLKSNVVSSQELYPNMVYPSSSIYPSAYHYITIENGYVILYQGNDIKYLGRIEMPSTLIGTNTIYIHQNTRILVDYIVGGAIAQRNIHLEGYTTINDGFSIDLEGNMTCNNANVNGVVNSTDGNIGGWTINNKGLTNGTVFLNSDGSSTIYTVADLIIIRGYIMEYEGFDLYGAMLQHYDINGDGVVNTQDYVLLQELIGIRMD